VENKDQKAKRPQIKAVKSEILIDLIKRANLLPMCRVPEVKFLKNSK